MTTRLNHQKPRCDGMTQKPKAELVIQHGRELGRTYLIRVGQRFSVGRAMDCAISLNDNQVSRYHAHLELTKHGLVVYDLDSRNGTYVNGRRLEGSTTIDKGVIRFGDHLLSVKTEDLQKTPSEDMERTRRIPRNFLPPEEFEILGIIGKGATGIVYAAHQKSLGRNVAIKFPRTDVADYDDCRARFIREGQLCCKIESPYVVSIYDMRLEGSRVFIVMELINGGSVYDRLATSIMPIDEIARIGEHVASALTCIHRLGIIHRDIKPANILLTPNGVAKLTDFGIAKALGDTSPQTRLTGSDEGLGTLGYVSPEGAACASLSTLSDIYTLGATLYHMVTNKAPFVLPQASVEAVISRILHQDPEPIRSLRPDCPGELEALITAMMSKDPEQRPADCYVVAARLEHIKRKYSNAYSRLLPQTSEFSMEDFQTDRLV